LAVEQFWHWLAMHYNCILRAGSDDCVIYDQNYLHWHLLEDEDGLWVVQIIRGKEVITELVIDRTQVLYVEVAEQEEEQVLFELMGSVDGEVRCFYHFLMAHGVESEPPSHGWTH
jgi:hypothetical protein